MSDIVAKLHEIDEAKIIYNIHRCRAGWGIIFYDPEKAPATKWREALTVERYYDSFEVMVEAEWRKLKGRGGDPMKVERCEKCGKIKEVRLEKDECVIWQGGYVVRCTCG